MEQIIALALFALIAIGGSVLRKYVEKQQRAQDTTKRREQSKAQASQWQREHGSSSLQGRKRTYYGRPRETPHEADREPAAHQPAQRRTARQAPPRPQRKRTGHVAVRPPGQEAARTHAEARPEVRPAEAAPATSAAHQTVAHQIRDMQQARSVTGTDARLGRLAESHLKTRRISGLLTGVGQGGVAAARVRPGGGPGYLGDLLKGRNLARGVVLAEVLGPPKGLQ